MTYDQISPTLRAYAIASIIVAVTVLLIAQNVAASRAAPGPSSAAPAQPEAPLVGGASGTHAPDRSGGASNARSGTATWLCDPPRYPRCTRGYPESSFVAARGSELPRSWQGKVVTVSWHGRSVDVRLVDTCLCKGARIIDLYAVAFRQLAPTGAGVLEGVRVALKGRTGELPLPPTDTDG
jgi:hypothetical protein